MTPKQAADVLGYLRVSTDEQGQSGLGLDAQRQVIEREAERRGWSVSWVVDDGHSAKTLARPGIQRALELLEDGGPDVLVVARLDRLSRSMLDFAGLMERARRQGWALVALDLGVDMTTAAGELIANVMAAVAQWERRAIAERTSAALQRAKARGQRLGRPSALPAKVVRRIERERAAGRSLQAIADGLNAEGVPTATGAGRWWPSTVTQALRTVEHDREAKAAGWNGQRASRKPKPA